jgi:sugar lactone lactonase YvrE
MTSTSETQVLATGLSFGESPRWHDGRLWVADWLAQELLVVEDDGSTEVVAQVPSFPFSIDWKPDGTLLVVSGTDKAVQRLGDDGSLTTVADLRPLCDRPWNEIVVDLRGNAYVNCIGFDMMGGEEPADGIVAVVTPYGEARQVADGVRFPNGMALTPDDRTLIVAESYGNRLTAFDVGVDGELSNRRTWAAVGPHSPDGICLDAEGAVWYADVGDSCCVRVAEGGEVLQRVDLDRGCFSCALGGPEGTTLYMVTMEWGGPEGVGDDAPTGQVVTTTAPARRAGRP